MKNFSLTCVLLLCLLSSAFAVEGHWVYRNFGPSQHNAEIILDAGARELTVGDLAANLRVCTDDEEFLCFTSDLLSFVVPRNLNTESTPWEYSGVEYRIVEHRDELMLGQSVSMFIIRAGIEGSDLLFYYSKHRGLIALSGANRIGTPLLSIEYCGFAAETECRGTSR